MPALSPLSLTGLLALAGLGLSTAHAGVWAHYPFDNDFADTSGNGRDGSLTDVGTAANSDITTTAGEFKFGGGAMNFSADRDFLAIPSRTFGTGTPYTIAFWAKKAPGDTGDPAKWDMVIGQRDTSIFFIGLNDGTGLRWRSNNNAGGTREADFNAPDDTNWHHYVLTADASKNLTFYLDGIAEPTRTNVETGIIIDTIGEAYATSRDFDFHGQIDEMWIFDETLDASSVNGLFLNNTPTPVSPEESLHHRYDGDFTDSSGFGNDGTASGAAAITTDPATIATGSGALALDGADGSHVALATPITLTSTDPWTISWWARRTEIGGQKGMIMGRRDNTNDFIWLNDTFTGLRFRSSNNITTHDFTVAQDINLHHYALVADGASNLSLYRDGQWTEDSTGNTSFTIDTIGNAYSTLSYALQGSLDEVHVFRSAKNATEIEQIYNDENPGSVSTVTRLRVFLLGGQSNADGRAASTSLPTSPVNLQQPQSDIDLYYRIEGGSGGLTNLRPGLSETSGFGPEITLGRRLFDLFADVPETRLAIVKYANGGTDLQTQWKAGGDATTTGDGPEYVTFQQTVTAGLAALAAAHPGATIEIEGMAWLQGESDVQNGVQAGYEANLTAFIADVRSTYGAELPFIVIRLSSGQTALAAPGLATLRAAQDAVAAADPRTGLVETDSFGMKADNLHFDAAGQQAIGTTSAEELVYLRWMLDGIPSAAIDAGQGSMTADYDGDGQNNGDEFIFGTLADDPLSFFAATISQSAPGEVAISYPGATDREYAVESWVSGTTWNPLLPAQSGTGGTDSRSISAPDPLGLYRIRAQLP